MAWNIKKITVEYLIYLLFWSILLLSPVLGSFIKDVSFFPTFEEMVSFWKFLLPALLLPEIILVRFPGSRYHAG